MTDHLAAARAAICVDHGETLDRYDLARAVGYIIDHLEAQQSEPEPDPLDETNHADRYDCHGTRWEWCDECDGLRMVSHEVHESGFGWTAAHDAELREQIAREIEGKLLSPDFGRNIDKCYGPLTFAPQPADTPTAAPQPEQAHGGAACQCKAGQP